MEKGYRIHTEISKDTLLNVQLGQDFRQIDVLSLNLKMDPSSPYKTHTSNYGVIVGRVLANDAFGIPNAKVSVYIPREDGDDDEMFSLYPYESINGNDGNGRRYNLLPDFSDDRCYRVVGTFPNKRRVLDNEVQLEVYEKYWKYTTVTNSVGDYMLFGIPCGSHEVHVDLDLSDIGRLSQKPRDFLYKGYNITQFDNANQFKESTNLNNLSQLFSQNQGVTVYPFWGDTDAGVVAISRCDMNIQYKFEPTCVFLGSIISDNDSNAIGPKCEPTYSNGKNEQLIAGEGTIEMIRITTDGLVEEFPIQGNRLIDSDGVWCYQIPMNLDYIGMDEYGNIVPTESPSKGIPTRTRVRFRISKTETGDEGFSRHTAKYLVPNNPEFDESKIVPFIPNGKKYEDYYIFGSDTPRECFRDMYWNNVYTVKNYIPKLQVSGSKNSKNYTALKGANYAGDKNSIPFNKLFISIPFTYVIICIIFQIVEAVVSVINAIIRVLMSIKFWRIPLIGIRPFMWIPEIHCISLAAGSSEGNTAFFPGCGCDSNSYACEHTPCPADFDNNCKKSSDGDKLIDIVQQNLAVEYNIVSLDLQNDWVNGTLYMPLWYWRKTKKKKFLFITIKKAKNEYCDCNKSAYSKLKTLLTCEFTYTNNSLHHNYDRDEDRWHKERHSARRFPNGLIKSVENRDGLNVYYYSSANAAEDQEGEKFYSDVSMFKDGFYAVRLYATDIVLLGSLDENNIFSVPAIANNIPSTTSNVPMISSVVDSDSETDDGSVNDDGAVTVTTGMDWGYKGSDYSPRYGSGLFLDLSCTDAKTLEKSCINVERISEYGMILDMTYSMPYARGSRIEYGDIFPDGFINKLEINATDERALFATMNHIGFIPDDTHPYGTERGYSTQIIDPRTGYMLPKFMYLYPTNFDGRLKPSMSAFRSDFMQILDDSLDETYLTFRFGAEKGKSSEGNNSGKIRHFNLTGPLKMPVYNNSFYFFFGINKGSTAIEKFQKEYMSECFQNHKYPFSMQLSGHGEVYCPQMYSSSKEGKVVYTEDAFANITAGLPDILTPYSYTLYDQYGMVVVSDNDVYDVPLELGFIRDDDGNITSSGFNMTETTYVDPAYASSGLSDGTYRLSVTDVNGKSLTETITIEAKPVSLLFEAHDLGDKYYNEEMTDITDICNKDTEKYGMLVVSGVSIDGTEFFGDEIAITVDNSPAGQGVTAYTFTIKLNDYPGTTVKCRMYLDSIIVEDGGTDNTFKGCACDATNRVSGSAALTSTMFNTDANKTFYSISGSAVTFYFYKPSIWTIEEIQKCDSEDTDNVSYESFTIGNGMPFNTFLNDMPAKFMLGRHPFVDSSSGGISTFYAKDVSGTPYGSDYAGWYGTFYEKFYRMEQFKTVQERYELWKDYVNLQSSDMNDIINRRDIVRYKFNMMFRLSNAVYEDFSFRYTSKGGVKPILTRQFKPDYDSMVEGEGVDFLWVDSTNSESMVPSVLPYSSNTSNKNYLMHAVYNESVGLHDLVGTYFAAFTNNGGFNDAGSRRDSSKKFDSLPTGTEVGYKREVGVNDTVSEHNMRQHFRWVYRTTGNTNPYLRALSVDRRIGHLMMYVGPVSDAYALYLGDNADNEMLAWLNTSRLSGVTFNGIEMAYDKDYSIISANTYATEIYLGYKPDGDVIYDESYNHNGVKTISGVVYHEWKRTDNDTDYSDPSSEDFIPDYLYTATNTISTGESNPVYYRISDDELQSWTGSQFADKYAIYLGTNCFATENNRLEFSYSLPAESGDSYTVYNVADTSTSGSVFPEDTSYRILTLIQNGTAWAINRGNVVDATSRPVIKRYKSSMFDGNDITDMYFSTFSQSRLRSKLIENTENAETRNEWSVIDPNHCIFYENDVEDVHSVDYRVPVFKYKVEDDKNIYFIDDSNLLTSDKWHFNGSFGPLKSNTAKPITTAVTYPSIRLIDIAVDAKPDEKYNFSITSCTYGTEVGEDDRGILTATAEDGESISYDFVNSQNVIFDLGNNDDEQGVKYVTEPFAIDNDGYFGRVFVRQIKFRMAKSRDNSNYIMRILRPMVYMTSRWMNVYPFYDRVVEAIKFCGNYKTVYRFLGDGELDRDKIVEFTNNGKVIQRSLNVEILEESSSVGYSKQLLRAVSNYPASGHDVSSGWEYQFVTSGDEYLDASSSAVDTTVFGTKSIDLREANTEGYFMVITAKDVIDAECETPREFFRIEFSRFIPANMVVSFSNNSELFVTGTSVYNDGEVINTCRIPFRIVNYVGSGNVTAIDRSAQNHIPSEMQVHDVTFFKFEERGEGEYTAEMTSSESGQSTCFFDNVELNGRLDSGDTIKFGMIMYHNNGVVSNLSIRLKISYNDGEWTNASSSTPQTSGKFKLLIQGWS